ncbi:MAG TPA: hypothetical protein VNK52_04495 [Hyphomicrobiaceae bacterium]|nr:hypothetical protein [Hyphomicrobiaceae bacterium]
MTIDELRAAPITIMAVELGVDRIMLVDDPSARYVASTVVPGRFIWEPPRRVERQGPTVHWWIDGRRFGGLVPVVFDARGNVDYDAMHATLRHMIEDSTRSASSLTV